MAQAGFTARPGAAAAVADERGRQRGPPTGSPSAPPPSARDRPGRHRVASRRSGRPSRAGRSGGRAPSAVTHERTAPCSPCATSRASMPPRSAGRSACRRPASEAASPACSLASERSSKMTDQTFESTLAAQLRTYAQQGVRPIDQYDVAEATIATGRSSRHPAPPPRVREARWVGSGRHRALAACTGRECLIVGVRPPTRTEVTTCSSSAGRQTRRAWRFKTSNLPRLHAADGPVR